MAFKQLSFEEKRAIEIKERISIILKFNNLEVDEVPYFQRTLDCFSTIGTIGTKNLDTFVKLVYGHSKDKNDLENFVAKLVAAINLISAGLYYEVYFKKPTQNEFNNYAKYSDFWDCFEFIYNNMDFLIENFPEYRFKFFDFRKHKKFFEPHYVLSNLKVIVDNLKNISSKDGNEILELLKPAKTDAELIGLLTIISAHFEAKRKIDKKKRVPKLSEIDNVIYDRAIEFMFILANNIQNGRHIGKSNLKITDIAHNFALNASLLYKLEKMNSSS